MLDRHSIGFADGSQNIWSMSHGYFVKQNEFELFKNDLEKKNFMGRWFPEASDVYQFFNREYAWSPSYQRFFGDPWLDYEVETGEKIITKHTVLLPKFINFKNKENDDIDDILSFEEQD